MKPKSLRAPVRARLSLVASAVLLAVLGAGCGRVPETEVTPVRRALLEAGRSGGDEYAPAAMDSARAWLARAEALNGDVPRTWYGRPRSDLIRAALDTTRVWIGLAAARADSLFEERLVGDVYRLVTYEERVDAMRGEIPRISGRNENRRLLRRLEVDLGEARQWLDREEPAAAESVFVRMEERLGVFEERLRVENHRFTSADALARWGGWIEKGLAESAAGKALLVVEKESRRSYLVRNRSVTETFPVELGMEGTRPKTRQGDLATPEGLYTVTRKKSNGETRYYKALLLDYPNQEDLERFRRFRRDGRLPAHARPGGLIEVHGNGGRGQDWTLGCVAVSDGDMDTLFARMAVGDRVVIVGRIPDRFRKVLGR